MREIRPSGSEGGVARKRHPYPYQTLRDARRRRIARSVGSARHPRASGRRPSGPLFHFFNAKGRGFNYITPHV
jgi:hypothetical protein